MERSGFYLEKCKTLAEYVLPDDFCGTVLNVATMFANSFEFEKGPEWSDFNVKRLEGMKQVGPNTFSIEGISEEAVCI